MKEMEQINIAGFITVRLGSTRLPNKALIKIKEKPTIVHLINRIKITKNLNKIVLCTTTNPDDKKLIKIARELNIDHFAGNEKDIIKRHFDTAIYHNVDFIINIDGDDLFCDPEYIDQIATEAKKNYLSYDVIQTKGLPFGVNSIGYNRNILEKILVEKKADDTETGWGEYFKMNKNLRVKMINAKEEHTIINPRMTLDYPEDLEFFRTVFDNLYTESEYMSLDKILNFLKVNTNVLNINKKIEEKYWINYKRKKVLK